MDPKLIYGTITSVRNNGRGVGGSRSSFVIKSENSTIEVVLPEGSFCPASIGDVVWGVYVTINQTNEFIQLPAVEIPMVEDAIKKAIVLALSGTSFNRWLIDQVYRFFLEETVRRLQTTISVARVSGNNEAMIAETITAYVEASRLDREGAILNLTNIGLTEEQAKRFLTWWRNRFTLRRLYLLGLTKREIRECSERGWEPSELHRQLTINPYIVEKVPFDKAVQIAKRYFLRLPNEYTECGRIVRYIDRECEGEGDFDKGKGWTCFPLYMLSKRYPNIFSLQTILKDIFRCRIRYNFLYLPHQAEAEDILTEVIKPVRLPPTVVNAETIRKLSPQQCSAVEMALNNTVSIITGAGGTGKTTTLAQLCDELEFREIPYIVAAFTGKAVARIKQVLTHPGQALTLHMIKCGVSNLKLGEGTRYLIIDEASQVDNCLLASVLKKISPNQGDFRIVLIGDPRQLQPFNGDMFNQLISSGKIPHVELTEDRRRIKTGCLFQNMKYLADGRPELFSWGEDCHFIPGGIPEVLSVVRELAQYNSSDDVTVVCPYNNINEELNRYIQEIFVPPTAPSIRDAFDKVWKLGARVMLLQNRYEIGVMNGEEGKITDINPGAGTIKVLFNDRDTEVDIPTFAPLVIGAEDDIVEQPLSTKFLTLSWAVTPDKAQGSQWDKVVFHFPLRNNGFLHKKRGYTAMARASRELFVITESEGAVRQMFITETAPRYDNLCRRIQKIPFQTEYVDPLALNRAT